MVKPSYSPATRGLTIITYTVEPATPSAQALQFLANWASEHEPSSTFMPD
jgi:hypothetical protein